MFAIVSSIGSSKLTMGKEGSNRFAVGSLSSMTLREVGSGKRHTNINAKSLSKLDHLRNLEIWAGGEASLLSLGAFLGHKLAAFGETFGLQPDPSLLICEKCETILQPGQNCTIRIEKNTAKAGHKQRKPNSPSQNIVVHYCHFCSHRNQKRGTHRHRMKRICLPKTQPFPKPKQFSYTTKTEEIMIQGTEGEQTDVIAPAAVHRFTPLVKANMTLL